MPDLHLRRGLGDAIWGFGFIQDVGSDPDFSVGIKV